MEATSSRPIEFTAVIIKSHREAFKAAKVQRGDTFALVPEPTNQYDENAIQIFKGQSAIGYVPRTDNKVVGRVIAAGNVQDVRCSVDWPTGFCVAVKLKDAKEEKEG
jgi:hypothetical protein